MDEKVLEDLLKDVATEMAHGSLGASESITPDVKCKSLLALNHYTDFLDALQRSTSVKNIHTAEEAERLMRAAKLYSGYMHNKLYTEAQRHEEREVKNLFIFYNELRDLEVEEDGEEIK